MSNPKTLVLRLVAKNILRGAIIMGIFVAFLVVLQVIGYAKTYPDQHSREVFSATLANNPGFSILYGKAHSIDTVAGYTAWRCMAGVIIIGSIWALFASTKIFRGQEEDGRWELLLVGPTTARRATANALLGIGIGAVVMYAVAGVGLVAIGKSADLNLPASTMLFFGLAMVAGIVEFLAIGALMSQLAPTRKQAAAYTAAIFGIAFLLRGVGDAVGGYNWLNYISPLGWVHLTQPLTNSQPLWLLPVGALIVVCAGLSIYLAGRRDLGESIIPDHDTAKPRLGLLNTSLGANFRLTRGTLIGWLLGIGSYAALMASITKPATKLVSDSPGFTHTVGKILGGSDNGIAKLFIGMGFYLALLALLVMVTAGIGAMRNDEDRGYLDNFLVRKVSRIEWLTGRIVIIASAVVAISLACGLIFVTFDTLQSLGISVGTLLSASANILAPSAFLLGLGIFVWGIKPRLTSIALYGLIIWSFVMEMVGSAIKMSHWVYDTSLLHHVSIAPAVNPNWTTNGVLLALGVTLGIVGSIAFTKRDLQSE